MSVFEKVQDLTFFVLLLLPQMKYTCHQEDPLLLSECKFMLIKQFGLLCIYCHCGRRSLYFVQSYETCTKYPLNAQGNFIFLVLKVS